MSHSSHTLNFSLPFTWSLLVWFVSLIIFLSL